jgi:hypothetical protein
VEVDPGGHYSVPILKYHKLSTIFNGTYRSRPILVGRFIVILPSPHILIDYDARLSEAGTGKPLSPAEDSRRQSEKESG